MSEENTSETYLVSLEKKLLESQVRISNIVDNLSKRLNCELREVIQLESEATSIRQVIISEKTSFLFKIYKDQPKIKEARRKQYEHHSAKCQFKPSVGEKQILIDADVAYHDAKIAYLENHINFINETIKTVDHIIWGCKNKIEIANITGLE